MHQLEQWYSVYIPFELNEIEVVTTTLVTFRGCTSQSSSLVIRPNVLNRLGLCVDWSRKMAFFQLSSQSYQRCTCLDVQGPP